MALAILLHLEKFILSDLTEKIWFLVVMDAEGIDCLGRILYVACACIVQVSVNDMYNKIVDEERAASPNFAGSQARGATLIRPQGATPSPPSARGFINRTRSPSSLRPAPTSKSSPCVYPLSWIMLLWIRGCLFVSVMY